MISRLVKSHSNQNPLVSLPIKHMGRVLTPAYPLLHRIWASRNILHEDFQNLIRDRTVALIWNSPILNGASHWSEIDDHDVVIRMNGGIITSKLNTHDTWVKTDIWASWAIHAISDPQVQESLNKIRESIKAIFITIQDQPIWREWMANLYIMYKFLFEQKAVYLPHSILLWLIWEIAANPSTGLRVFESLIKIGSFSQLTLYWFSFNSDHRIYWSDRNGTTPTSHRFDREEDYILWKVNENRATIKK